MTMLPDSPDVQILRALLQAPGEFYSGQDLASQLGISRVAVWKRLENLKKQGFSIEAIRKKGYRLGSSPESASEAGILARLPGNTNLRQLTLFDTSSSTNNDVMRLLATGAEAPLACISRRQPGGKGRRGRNWSGDFDGNLYGSLGFRPDIHPRRTGLLTLWTGLRICRRIGAITQLPIQLKWPNDLYLDGRKLAGILSESTLETERITSLVIGIGMNINMTTEDIPADLRTTATSLRIGAGHTFQLDGIIAAIVEEVLGAMDDCLQGIDEDRLADEWERFACFLGETVYVLTSDGKKNSGTLSGIDRAGSLLLRDSSGRLQSFRAGDVSLRPEPGF
ncbi:MAG: biotin--[acetyl-CoA-carboxylase] ligase [Puniceicoccales bacterium]